MSKFKASPETAHAAAAMLHKLTHPLVVAVIEKDDLTPVEQALVDALESAADLIQAQQNQLEEAQTDG